MLLCLVVFQRQDAAPAFPTALFQHLDGPRTNPPASPTTSIPTEAVSLMDTHQRAKRLKGLGFRNRENIHFGTIKTNKSVFNSNGQANMRWVVMN